MEVDDDHGFLVVEDAGPSRDFAGSVEVEGAAEEGGLAEVLAAVAQDGELAAQGVHLGDAAVGGVLEVEAVLAGGAEGTEAGKAGIGRLQAGDAGGARMFGPNMASRR